MLGFATYAALLPELRDLWQLSNSQAGLVGGMFFAGYIATVSYWTALTDRVDGRTGLPRRQPARRGGRAGFGLAADGLRERGAVPGAARRRRRGDLHAGTAPALGPHRRARAEPLHRLLHLVLRHRHRALARARRASRAAFGWRTAFVVSRGGPAAGGGLLVWLLIEATSSAAEAGFSSSTLFPLAAWRKVLADRAAAGYTLRLLRALPGAVRLARLDGRVSRLLRDAARRRQVFPGRPPRSPRW